MAPPIRVLHLINGLGTGGAERSLQEMLPGFHANGLAPEIAVFHERAEGVQEHVLGTDTPVHFVGGGRWARRIRAVRRLIRERRPDVIHTTIFEADVIGRLAAFGTGVPVVSSLVNTSYDASRDQDPRVNPRKLRAARRIDAFTARRMGRGFHAITPPVKDSAIETLGIPGDRIEVIPRGRSESRLGARTDERRAEARAHFQLADGTVALVNVGRREFQKAQDVLIEAMPAVLESHPECVLLIAGREGNTSRDLDERVRRLGLGDRVRFLGHTDRVPDLLCAADLFVFPSRFEGLGGSLIEALALDLPIVASDIAPIRYVLANGEAGLLVTPDDTAGLSRAILDALDHPSATRDRVRAGRERFEQAFRLEAVTEAMATWLKRMAR